MLSIYGQLLDTALHERRQLGSRGQRLAELLRCRGQLRGSEASNRVADALADQLAYDVALIDLAQHLGIDCDAHRFDQPPLERRRLEDALAMNGVPLPALEDQASPAPRQR